MPTPLPNSAALFDPTDTGTRARQAWRKMAVASASIREGALKTLAQLLESSPSEVLAANDLDVAAALAAGMSGAMVERLTLNPARMAALSKSVFEVAAMPDPIGECYDQSELPNGLKTHRQRVPLGVLGVVYESRPNVTIDVAALAFRTGNAAILRGGKEALRTNAALIALVHTALEVNGLPADVVQFIDDPDRGVLLEFMEMSDYVDVIIPRGGEGLQRFCREHSRIPVITGGVGICHLFVDASADLGRSLEVITNAKTQRPSVCNALDTVLIHRAIASRFIPTLLDHLGARGVSFRADPSATPYLAGRHAEPAGVEDFDTEWLDLILGVKVVDSIEEAIEHIEAHGSGHSDGILTEDAEHAAQFTTLVDSAAVFVNASTRFNDGGQLGLGAEVAVSTQRLHVRGPMGIRELTSYKWVVEGNYSVRA